jgi:GH35 family endo-1,4-beta-xylanase
MVYNAGSRWDRFDFIWPNIESTNDGWNFGAYDAVVNDLNAVGMNMVGILLWTPDWAATSGLGGFSTARFDQRSPDWYAPAHGDPLAPLVPSAASSPPQGLYLSWNDPNNHWGDYVYTVVSRYKDRVKHWEMWNEPEWSYLIMLNFSRWVIRRPRLLAQTAQSFSVGCTTG